jgi:hypothetical protein
MSQQASTAAAWPLRGLETAIRALGDSAAEKRVRRQFHQLLSALEHDGVVPSNAEPLLSSFVPLDRLQ